MLTRFPARNAFLVQHRYIRVQRRIQKPVKHPQWNFFANSEVHWQENSIKMMQHGFIKTWWLLFIGSIAALLGIQVPVSLELSKKQFQYKRTTTPRVADYLLSVLQQIWVRFEKKIFLIVIHSMQGWTATTRHVVTRKRNTKRLRHIGNLFRKNLHLKDVC